MVGVWTPEPPREPGNENLSTAGAGIVVVEQDSTDSEGEDPAYTGYELLSQLPPDQPDSASDDTDDAGSGGDVPGPSSSVTNAATTTPVVENSGAVQMGSEFKSEEERNAELREVWSAPSGNSIEMGSEQAEQVRAAMANFALPQSAFPAWATAVPEEQWKQQLLERIQRLQQQPDNAHPKT